MRTVFLGLALGAAALLPSGRAAAPEGRVLGGCYRLATPLGDSLGVEARAEIDPIPGLRGFLALRLGLVRGGAYERLESMVARPLPTSNDWRLTSPDGSVSLLRRVPGEHDRWESLVLSGPSSGLRRVWTPLR